MRRALTFALVAAACSSGTPGKLTVGVQAEALDIYLQSLHVVTTVDGQTASDATFRASQGAVFPREIPVDPHGDPNADVSVRVEGFATDDPTGQPPAIVRTAHTTMLPAPSDKLLRIDLDTLCVLVPPPGGLVGPTCSAPGQTCIAGQCVSDTIGATSLADYTPTWAIDTPDACRPANPGAPTIVVGTGQSDYFPLTDGQTVQAQTGPQGGHHIWVALRMQNLKQSGSTTTVTATEPDTGATVAPLAVVFTYQPDEGGFCKLYGLRFQLDANGVDLNQFLGKPLDVKVEVHDTLGEDGSSVAHINVDPNVLPL
ncbi:MAG TPA: hypothetical protein VGH28_31480 [Polyangiaceae bacterium]|jgi:hypothetical protein